MIDIEAVRADTPACDEVLHFNNAGASLMPDPVFNALMAHLQLERRMGGYEAAHRAEEELANFYREFAALLGVHPHEIAYIENATRAWDMAFYGLPLQAGDRILTHASEYASNYLALLQQAKRRGWQIDIVPSDSHGQIDVHAMETMIGPNTRAVAITHVPSHGGLVNPVEVIGEMARKYGLIFLLDACQSVGQIDLDVKRIGCHVLTGTGRKFLRGPRGTGFLYVADEIIDSIEPPFIDLHSARWSRRDSYEFAPGARRYETWEGNVSGKIGLARAVCYAREIGVDQIEQRVTCLAAQLRRELAAIPGIVVEDRGRQKCAIVSFQKRGEAAAALAARLRENNINVSVTELSSARLDLGERGLDSLLRASPHYFNTENEIDRFIEIVKRRQ